mmetsp:Transcript_5336/g.7866  ORF Transcript_5336/g.7866 Transcript_5336/m.7866 type:complete len:260 (+) Transcript_5336:13-792(+)
MEKKDKKEQEVWVEAKYSYDKQKPDEISFRAGDRIKVLEKHVSGWWSGELKGADGQMRRGNFPSNFVRENVSAPSSQRTSVTAASANRGAAHISSNYNQDNCSSAFLSSYRDRRLRMIFRMCQLGSIIVSFGVGADQESYTEHAEFRALVGIGVAVFLYVIAWINIYIFNVEAHWKTCCCVEQNPSNLMESVFDALFAFILLAALIAAINKSQSLNNTTLAKISGVFAFLTFLLLVGSSIVNWRLYKEKPKHQGAIELA